MNAVLRLLYFKKVNLMKSHNWYQTMSGDWCDSHMMRRISKHDFVRMTLDELREAVSNG